MHTLASANAADWLAAIGTVSAVVVALGLALLPASRRWLRRPRLVIKVGETEPHVRLVEHRFERGLDEDQLRLRLEIVNEGATEARRVRVSIRKWWELDGDKWIDRCIDPMQLRWVTHPRPMDEGERIRTGLETDLAADDSNFVDLAYLSKTSGGDGLRSPDLIHRPFSLESNRRNGERRAQVVVVAENAEIVRTVVSYRTSPESWFSDVHVSSAPKDASPGALLGILKA